MPRPRIHPAGQAPTSGQRRAAADARLREAGGANCKIALSAAALARLAALRAELRLPSNSAVIERLLTR